LGIGHLLGARLSGFDYRVYVLLGDGECESGQIWEEAMAAAHFKTDRLIAILDYNKFQETGPISREMALEPLVDKWRSFGWFVNEVDGYDVGDVVANIKELQQVDGQPAILIAHTIKGKGVSFVEADFTYHERPIVGELADKAREEIRCG
jgi:transketolase